MHTPYSAACHYLSRSWSTLPLCPPDHALPLSNLHLVTCRSQGKAPIGPWKHLQETLLTEESLRLAWDANEHLNVGVIMGPVSRLVGIDVDDQEGEILLAVLGNNDLPLTLAFTTPRGGKRFLYELPIGIAGPPTHNYQGADHHEILRILGKGSLTVMPLSRHANGGTYHWLHEGPNTPLAMAPDWLLKLQPLPPIPQRTVPLGAASLGEVSAESETAVPTLERARRYLAACDPAISGQGGHNQTLTVASKLVKGFALPADIAFNLLWEEYNPRCTPPWSSKELEHKITEANRHSTLTLGSLLNERTTAPALPPRFSLGALANNHRATPSTTAKDLLTRLDSVAVQDISWIWPQWLPTGKLAILDGDPGLGKSTMTLDLAARVSRDGIMPDGQQGACGNVLLLSAEDDLADTLKPRLLAAGANQSRIFALDRIPCPHDKTRTLEIPGDIPLLDQLIAEAAIRLLIIDPIMAFLVGVDANKDQSIRQALYQLSCLCQKHQVTILALRHLNKGSGQKAIYRGNSSIAMIGHARTGLLVAQDPSDPEARILAVSKCNLAALPSSLRFRLATDNNICKIQWLGTSPLRADDLVATTIERFQDAQQENTRQRTSTALAFLEDLLKSGPVRIDKARSEAAKSAISLRSLERAVTVLRLQVVYHLDDGNRVYFWAKEPTNTRT